MLKTETGVWCGCIKKNTLPHGQKSLYAGVFYRRDIHHPLDALLFSSRETDEWVEGGGGGKKGRERQVNT